MEIKTGETSRLVPEEDQSDPNQPGCKAFNKLINWQVDQYRMAIDENKWYMGERLGRPVDWQEAENDFLHKGYYGRAPIWRKQFCESRCEFHDNCSLAQLFVDEQVR